MSEDYIYPHPRRVAYHAQREDKAIRDGQRRSGQRAWPEVCPNNPRRIQALPGRGGADR